MADIGLKALPRLGGVDLDIAGTRIVERHDLALVSVAIPKGGEAPVSKAFASAWKLDLPTPTQSTSAGEMMAIRSAPDQIMLLFPHPTPDAEAMVRGKLDGAGYTSDQTDGWVILELSGALALSALERVCPLDVDPARFPNGCFGRTVMEHMGTIVLRRETGSFLLMTASSWAESFLHAIETSVRNVAP